MRHIESISEEQEQLLRAVTPSRRGRSLLPVPYNEDAEVAAVSGVETYDWYVYRGTRSITIDSSTSNRSTTLRSGSRYGMRDINSKLTRLVLFEDGPGKPYTISSKMADRLEGRSRRSAIPRARGGKPEPKPAGKMRTLTVVEEVAPDTPAPTENPKATPPQLVKLLNGYVANVRVADLYRKWRHELGNIRAYAETLSGRLLGRSGWTIAGSLPGRFSFLLTHRSTPGVLYHLFVERENGHFNLAWQRVRERDTNSYLRVMQKLGIKP